MKNSGYLLTCLLGLGVPFVAVVACSSDASDGGASSSGQDAGEDASTPFVPSPDLVEVGNTGLYLPAGSERVPGAPPATDPASAPVIQALTHKKVDDHTIVVDFEVETVVTVKGSVETAGEVFIYVDFGVTLGIYKTRPTFEVTSGGSAEDPPNWKYLDVAGNCRGDLKPNVDKTPIWCTPECVTSCDCIMGCGHITELGMRVRECALSCVRAERDGTLARDPFNGSKDFFAAYLYDIRALQSPPDGYAGTEALKSETARVGIARGSNIQRLGTCKLSGTCAMPPPFAGGDAGTPPASSDAGAPTKSRRVRVPRLTFKGPDFSQFGGVMFASIAQQAPTDGPVATSPRTAPAQVSPPCLALDACLRIKQ